MLRSATNNVCIVHFAPQDRARQRKVAMLRQEGNPRPNQPSAHLKSNLTYTMGCRKPEKYREVRMGSQGTNILSIGVVLPIERMPGENKRKVGQSPSQMSNLRILVADDHDIIRRGLKQLLTAPAREQRCGLPLRCVRFLGRTEQIRLVGARRQVRDGASTKPKR